MADFVLTVGGVGFQDLEVPDSIKAGGAQAIALHKYAGGARTGDTQGPDDDLIAWSGWFEDGTAQARCRAIDTMRRQGLPIIVAWSGYSYLALIKHFHFDFRRFYHIRYEISIEVLQDQTQPLPQAPADAEAQIQSDTSDSMAMTTALIAAANAQMAGAVDLSAQPP